MIAVELPSHVEQRLDRLAALTGQSKETYIHQAIVQYLEELDDIEIAEDRLDALRTGQSSTVPLEQMMREHGTLEG